jgi:hypothetical protein
MPFVRCSSPSLTICSASAERPDAAEQACENHRRGCGLSQPTNGVQETGYEAGHPRQIND